jgi:hypothetical protein
MKISNYILRSITQRAIAGFLTSAALIASVYLPCGNLSAQGGAGKVFTPVQHKLDKVRYFNYGLNIGTSLSGNGLANSYLGGFSLIHSRSRVSFDANFQGDKKNFSGVSGIYDFTVNPQGEGFKKGVELFFSVMASYQFNAYLSSTIIDQTKEGSADQGLNLAFVRLNVVEGFGGMGARIALARHFKLMARIGAGEYITLNKEAAVAKTCRNDRDVCLKIGLGVAYVF